MRPLRVAAAQTVSTRGAVPENVEHHCWIAERAAGEGSEVVVFPELSLTGYELDIASDHAFSLEDERLTPLVDVAAAREIILVVGAPARLPSGLHIGAFVIEPDRSVGLYTKQHLYGDERAVFAAGHLDPLVEFSDDRAALAICADTSYPEHAEAAAKRGATAYLAGVFFDPDGYAASADRLAGYASRHAMAVVMANAGGPATGYDAAGRSAIWSDAGELVARLEGTGAGLVMARRSDRGWSGEAMRL